MSGMRPAARRTDLGAYEATSTAPRVQDWESTSYSPNAALDDSATARARTQDAVRNNPWLRRAVKLLVSHMIGCGIQPRPKIKDKALRTEIITLWNDWTAQADADGVLGFYAMQGLMARSQRESGEVFTRLVVGGPRDNLVVPLQLRLIEADLLSTRFNDPTRNIRQGIERNRAGRRTAYHFYREHPGERFILPTANTTQRIPASEILHYYCPDRPGQLRGAPEGISTLYRARNLDKYESAELTRKLNKAKFSGVIYKENQEENPVTDAPANPILINLQRQLATVESSADYTSGVETALAAANSLREQIIIEQERKTFVDVDEGYMLQLGLGERAEFPGGDTGNNTLLDFLRSQLRAIAAGWGVPYETLVGDYADTNDRIMRVILNVFYRQLEADQDHFIAQILQPIYQFWLTTGVLSKALSIPDYFDNLRLFQRCEWRAQAWTYVNPLQEVQTKALRVKHGFTSRAAVVAEDGWDVEDVDNEQATDHEREQRLGLSYSDTSKTDTADSTDDTQDDKKDAKATS